MGGKHKVANRTKNNARPSNSGRSAEFLGTSVPPFVGFSGIKDSAFGFSLSNSEEVDASLDPNIQVILKKITKRDSTTKIKGLQEFSTFVKASDADNVKSILPVWARFYNVLATDTDNRVREATHNVHHQIVLKVKRKIAPYLKQLMAPWFTSQYDTYPPAASIASQAFTDAFPPNKIQEAIVFCQEEILNYLSDNLLVQTAHTLSNLKNVSAEEAEAKYERVLISCLQGYCLYLEKVSIDQIKIATELNNSIISNPKFWKFSRSKVALVRASFFQIVSVLCQKAAFLLDEKGSQVVNSVFTSLDDHDPTVLPRIWEATLLTMSTIKEWWTLINIDKLFLPKLWKILKDGGQGNASVIYPSLLPLISYLPPTIDKTVPQFYSIFFENMWLGLNKTSTASIRSESVAIATALIECLQYVILKKQSDIPFCKTLIKNNILTSIEWCLTKNQTNYKSLFNQISSLVQHWSRNLESEALKTCLDFFLENIHHLYRDTLFNIKEIPDHDVAKVAEKQLDFLQSLRYISKSKKQLKVKFIIETDDYSEHKPEQLVKISDDKIYLNHLNNLVYKICEHYVQYISEKKSKILIQYLYSLVIDFDTKNLFLYLNETMKHKKPNSRLIDIYTTLLNPWLNSQELCCKYVIRMIFLLFEYVEIEDRKMILSAFLEVPSEECLSWCFSEALSHPHNKDPLVKDWLRTERITKFIVTITDKIISDECPPDLEMLFKLALTENEHGELFINKEAIENITCKLISTVQHYSDFTVTADTCSSLAAYISTVMYTENLLLTYGDTLLLALFRLSCNPDIDNDIISKETIYEVTTSWQDAITLLTNNLNKEDSLSVASKLADIVEEEFLKNNNLDEAITTHFIGVVVNALTAIYKSRPLCLFEFLEVFVERSFVSSIEGYVEELCMLAEYINGNLSSTRYEIKMIKNQIGKIDVARYFAWIYFKIGIVSSVLKDTLPEEKDEDTNEKSPDDKPVLILSVIDRPETFVTQVLHDLCVGETYLKTYKNTMYYDSILHYHVLTEMTLKSALDLSDDLLMTNIKSALKERATKMGWHWAKAAYFFYSQILPVDLPTIYQEFAQDVSETDRINIVHLTQTFKKDLNFVRTTLETIEDVVFSNCVINCDEMAEHVAEVLAKMESIRSRIRTQFESNSNDMSWENYQEIIEFIRLCTSMIKFQFHRLNQKNWDLIVLSLVSWASNCLKEKHKFKQYQFQALLCAVVNLYVEIDNQVFKNQELSKNYIGEWENVLAQSVHNDLLHLWLFLAVELRQQEEIITYIPLILEFSKTHALIKYNGMFESSDTLPKWSKFLKQSCLLLVNPQPHLQLWGYKMLLILVPGLINIDTESVNTNTPHIRGLIFEQFKEKLVEMHEIVNNILMGFKLGEDSCRVEPMTDSFTYTFAYLLLWDILLTLCDKSSTELRFQYADWLRNEDLLKNFLNNLFKLMPADVLQYSEIKSNSLKEPFLKKPEINFKDICNSEKIEFLVCWLYSSTLTQLPAIVRQWWTGLDSKLAQIVEKVTQCYVSPHLVVCELNELLTYQSKFKNMVLKVLPGTREIIAIYTVDEAQVELLITLPPNYPLGGLDVQCNRQIAGASHKQWLLQFKKCVVHQNGRIWDGLSLWNNNLDKKFDGVEECYICFAVLHPGTYQLPKLSCQTCKKKFHSACLYKWFRISYKSSCPICRNLF